ncbi:MAG: COX15/CtaA family protein [Legionella sp.]
MQIIHLRKMVTIALLLALFVVMLGAYTRLTDAGLGCPDWPGCYGHLVLPSDNSTLASAQNKFPEIPIERVKAWTEMAHRYVAGTLGLLIAIIFVASLMVYRSSIRYLVVPSLLVALVIFQATLGMWTVTLKLLPIVVMGHLLGGILIFVTLCYYRLKLGDNRPPLYASPKWRFWMILGIIITFMQIALGGWVSSNYAGIACIGFPRCNGNWLPDLYFLKAFNVLSPLGANYQGGLLDSDIRATIQFTHRLGALITALYVFVLSLVVLIRMNDNRVRTAAIVVITILSLQFVLGVVNVIFLLPLWSAVVHNGCAALLLAAMVTMLYLLRGDVYDASHQ